MTTSWSVSMSVTLYWFMDVPDDLTPYDAVEVHPVGMWELVDRNDVVVNAEIEIVDESTIGTDPNAIYFWSVYLHFDPRKSNKRGISCVADCRTKAEAYGFAEELETRLRDVIGDALIPMRGAAA